MQSGPLIWMVVSDAEFTANPFMPGNPEELMSTGQFNTEIEVIVGHNSDEGLLFVVAEILDPSLWVYFQVRHLILRQALIDVLILFDLGLRS